MPIGENANKDHTGIESETRNITSEMTIQTLHANLLSNNEALDYLYERGITDEAISHFQLGWQPLRTSKLHNRIIFPLISPYGDLLACQGRAISHETKPKYWHQPFDKSSFLYGLYETKECIVEQDWVCIVEGNFDVIVAWQEGIPAIGLQSTNLSLSQALILRRYCSNVVKCLDNDKAGVRAAEVIDVTLKEALFEVHQAPDIYPAKDLNDLLLLRGNGSIASLFAEFTG